MNRKYVSAYARIVANCKLAIPGDLQSCWIWQGPFGSGGYPLISMRRPGVKGARNVLVHRLILEEHYDILFPHDEAGHLCNNPTCVNPNHLEVQTHAFNLMCIPGRVPGRKILAACLIPTIYPRGLGASAPCFPAMPPAPDDDDDDLWDRPGTFAAVGDECPF